MTLALAAMVTVLATVALAVSVYAFLCAHKLVYAARKNTAAAHAGYNAAIERAQLQIDAVALELQSVKSQTPAEILPGMPKPGMNLTRRSKALRLHRTGASPEQIANSLEVPRQEVDLLLKVHAIVLNNL
jgi:hypothetical protein